MQFFAHCTQILKFTCQIYHMVSSKVVGDGRAMESPSLILASYLCSCKTFQQGGSPPEGTQHQLSRLALVIEGTFCRYNYKSSDSVHQSFLEILLLSGTSVFGHQDMHWRPLFFLLPKKRQRSRETCRDLYTNIYCPLSSGELDLKISLNLGGI